MATTITMSKFTPDLLVAVCVSIMIAPKPYRSSISQEESKFYYEFPIDIYDNDYYWVIFESLVTI